MAAIHLANYRIPFPPGPFHTGFEESGGAAVRWMRDHGLGSDRVEAHLATTRPQLLAAFAFPDIAQSELDLITQWLAWAFLLDDELDDQDAAPGHCGRTIEGLIGTLHGSPTRTPMERAVADLAGRTFQAASPGQQRQLLGDTEAWLWTYFTEAVDRAAGRMLPWTEFRVHRRDSVAMFALLDLHDLVNHIELSDTARNLRSYQALRAAVAEHSGVVNDICSYEKEQASGYTHNTVCVLQAERELSVDAAKASAEALLAEIAASVLHASADIAEDIGIGELSETDREALGTCVDGYRTIARADFDFHTRVPRYQAIS
ncbi:hypothetical protein ACFROC_08820 [Nocardia tengchongensis]|uniref:terpene synthase family protein n=1 Tax=Nocardia tengchongensis TaxID=2055889 RepID=UPI0036AEE374